jgi:predicted DNA-binding transcriptional regulator YafY
MEHYGRAAGGYSIEVEFQAPLSTVQQKIPASYGSLTATTAGALLRSEYDDLDDMARYLMVLNLPFVVHQPPELREALLRLAERMVKMATAGTSTRGNVSEHAMEEI